MNAEDGMDATQSASAARRRDLRLDLELEQTFPASDAIPWIHEVEARRPEAAQPRHLDDFSPGQRFVTGTLRVDVEAIKAFAADFDPQPFHLDETTAAQTLLGGLCASGWHTGAMTMRLLVDSDLRIAGGLVGLGGEVTWPRPVRPGDTLHVEIDVLKVTPSRSKPDRGTVTARIVTLNQHGEPVQIAVMKLLAPRRRRDPA